MSPSNHAPTKSPSIVVLFSRMVQSLRSDVRMYCHRSLILGATLVVQLQRGQCQCPPLLVELQCPPPPRLPGSTQWGAIPYSCSSCFLENEAIVAPCDRSLSSDP
ncbi:unnamed protein product [Amoebophrya sp. A25]|nr:unnamed protein product [Amoebophrya sp. A25]|eukprot:GSA25T00026735001.1